MPESQPMCETSSTSPGRGNPTALTTPGTCWPLPWDQGSPLLNWPWPPSELGAAGSVPCCCSAATRTGDQAGMQAGNGCLTSEPSPCTHTGHRAPRQLPGLCPGTGKTLGKVCREEPEYSATLVCSSPHTRVCAQCTPTHACASLCKSDSLSCTPAPPAIRLSVCPLPAPTEHPSLPPPPERFRSVSIDKSGALPRRRCNGAQRVRGCRGAQAHSGAGGAGWIHAWDCTHVTSQVCGCTGVGFPGCVVAHVCAPCRRRVCTRVRVCTHARTDVCSACAGLWGLGDPTLGQRWQTGPSTTVWFLLQQCREGNRGSGGMGFTLPGTVTWGQGQLLDGGTLHCHHL